MFGAISIRGEVLWTFKMSFSFGATWHVRALQLHLIFLEAGGSQHPGACGRGIGSPQLCL